jgi:6-phosphogluconolactonase
MGCPEETGSKEQSGGKECLMTHSVSRRIFLESMGLGIMGITAAEKLVAGLRLPGEAEERTLFIGTYAKEKSEGIYRGRLDLTSGSLRVESGAKGITNPSFLAIDGSRGRLYAVNETAEFEGRPGGSVSAFAIDPKTADLRFLNRQSSHGGDPCHLTLDHTGRYVLVANYSGGNIAVLPVKEDGSLGEATDVVQHQGSSVTPRQTAPHPHSVNVDVSGNFIYVPDLGTDRVMIYRLDAGKGKLLPATRGWAGAKAGAGPRHMVFHPDGRNAYVLNELDTNVTRFAVDRSTGALEQKQAISTVPRDFTGANFPADIHLSSTGDFVYCSNRGHDSIAVFAVDRKTGELSILQVQPTGGKWPRNFTIDPTGRYLLVANQRSDSITVFSVDQKRGTLAPLRQQIEIPMPVCLKFL